MRYFLGYILQILLEFREDDRPLLILSDEPDFALSAVGQRDLLRFFRRIIKYERNGSCSQIIFTTHSPELIDPNHPDRIVVLRKGLFDEGTIVINKVHHRLFEPVRSALSGRTSSLPFIDGPNLVVEGVSDQTFIVRMSQYLASRDLPHLDLSYLSIVVAQGCKRIPSIVRTANSIAGDRAYLTILLDNDEEGRALAEEIVEIDGYYRDNNQIVSIFEVLEPGLGKDTEIEDLVPPRLYYEAFRNQIKPLVGKDRFAGLPEVDWVEERTKDTPMSKVIRRIISENFRDESDGLYDKEMVIEEVFNLHEQSEKITEEMKAFEKTLIRFSTILLDRINYNLKKKRHDEVRRSIQYAIRQFAGYNPYSATKWRAEDLLEQIRELGNRISPIGAFDTEVDSIVEAFEIRKGLKSEELKDYDSFLRSVRSLPQKLTIDPDLTLM